MKPNKNDTFIDPVLLTPHFSTRIYGGYLLYLKRKYGLEKAKKIVAKTGVPWDYLTSDNNWISETYAENFFEVLSKVEDIDPDYSYQSAVLSLSRETQGPVQWLAMRLLDPKVVYKKILFFSRQFNKVDQISVTLFKNRQLKFELTVRETTKFFDEIIENWSGFLTHIPTLMGLPPSKLNATKLSNNKAEFEVAWLSNQKLQAVNILQPIAVAGALGFGLGFLASLIPPLGLESYTSLFTYGTLTSVIAWLSSTLFRKRISDMLFGSRHNDFERIIRESEDRYNELYQSKQKLDRRYREANILAQVLQRITQSTDTLSLVTETVKQIQEILRYDRVIFMNFEKERNQLAVYSTAGFDEIAAKVLEQYSIDLKEETDSSFHLGNVFKTKQSILIPITSEYFDNLSEEGKKMLYLTKSSSFLAVTVAFDHDSYGVLLVDYQRTDKVLDQEDLHIIKNVANQMAISIRNSEMLEHEKHLRKKFQQFVPPQIIKSLLTGEEEVHKKGNAKTVTVLFSDLRDFTKNASNVSPEIILISLNLYLEKMTEIIYSYGGIVDKFLGDGILALFNAFEDSNDHDLRAVQAAYAMQNSLEALNKELQNRLKFMTKTPYELRAGIGVHRGDVILGTLGTAQKSEFTAIGDPVNVTSRLLGLTKLYGANSIIISEDVNEHVRSNFLSEDIGHHEIRGLDEEMKLYLIRRPLEQQFILTDVNDTDEEAA